MKNWSCSCCSSKTKLKLALKWFSRFCFFEIPTWYFFIQEKRRSISAKKTDYSYNYWDFALRVRDSRRKYNILVFVWYSFCLFEVYQVGSEE